MTEQKLTSEDTLGKSLKCLCEGENCEIELRVIDMGEKVKLQILNSKDIDSIVISKKKLKELLE